MPVIVEAFNVIVRNETIVEKFPGGLGAYWLESPNHTMCGDDFLTRVGFLNMELLHTFLDKLMDMGFRVTRDPDHTEIAIVDQLQGVLLPCRWIHIADHPDGFRYAALPGDLDPVIEKPPVWSFENSMTESVKRSVAEAGRVPPPVTSDALNRWLDSLVARNKPCMPAGSDGWDSLDDPQIPARMATGAWMKVEAAEATAADVAARLAASEMADGYLGADEVELRAEHLVAIHGDTVRPVWIVEPCGEAYPIGDVPVRDVPLVLSNAPAICLVIEAVEPGDLVGVVKPAYPIDDCDADGLTNEQRQSLSTLSGMFGSNVPERKTSWWNPVPLCRRLFGTD